MARSILGFGDVPLSPVVLTDRVLADLEPIRQVPKARLRNDTLLRHFCLFGRSVDPDQFGVLLTVGHLVDVP